MTAVRMCLGPLTKECGWSLCHRGRGQRQLTRTCMHSRPLSSAQALGHLTTNASLKVSTHAEEKTFQGLTDWVVFSDLHVSTKTLPVCLDILRQVHQEAVTRKAGVLFLGDWWHIRGSLPVQPLNEILQELSKWTQPTLMLVGNHDQVTLGGLHHALTPLAACNPDVIHVVDRPCVMLDALWLPYRHDHGEVLTAISGALDNEGLSSGISAVFAHADIIGASVNDICQAREGLPPTAFPDKVPVFTGHYHKPHTVPSAPHITYIGSPYQVSWGEIDQKKRLLVLRKQSGNKQGSLNSWRVVEDIPLDIGPRHHMLPAVLQEVHLQPLQPGDRVKWQLAQRQLTAQDKNILLQLKGKGVHVQVMLPEEPDKGPRIQAAERLQPTDLIKQYAQRVKMSQASEALAIEVLKESLLSLNHLAPQTVTLCFHQVEISGFGPFCNTVEYSLAHGGLRVISGANNDAVASDSNGSGKTALVMSALWALTGRGDGRTDAGAAKGMANADVINDDSSRCSVTVSGQVNGKHFKVNRTIKRQGKKGHVSLAALTLMVEGEDVTKAEARLTQAAINELVGGTELLARIVFFGQNDITFLLEANDGDTKAEFGKIIDLDLWQQAASVNTESTRKCKETLTQLQASLTAQLRMLDKLRGQVEQSQSQAVAWQQHHSILLSQIEEQLSRQTSVFAHSVHQACSTLQPLQRWSKAAAFTLAAHDDTAYGADVDAIEHSDESLTEVVHDAPPQPVADRDPAALTQHHVRNDEVEEHEVEEHEVSSLEEVVKQWEHEMIQRQKELQGLLPRLGLFQGAREAAEQQFQQYSSLHSGHVPHAVCDRCLQHIDAITYNRNLERLQADYAISAAQEREIRQAIQLQKERWGAAEVELRNAQAARNQAASRRSAQLAARLRDAATARQAAEQLQKEAQARRQAAFAEVQRRARVSSQVSGLIHRVEEAAIDLAQLQQKRVDLVMESYTAADQTIAQQAGEEPDICASPLSCLDWVTENLKAFAQHIESANASLQSHHSAAQRLAHVQQETNPHLPTLQQWQSEMVSEEQQLTDQEQELAAIGLKLAHHAEVDAALGRTGIPSYLLEGFLGELQGCVSEYMSVLAPDLHLVLTATTTSARGKEVERIDKSVFARLPDGRLQPRSVRQLSGGERRRLALALALGYRQLAAQRGRLDCNLLVLDEVLQHLDQEGCMRVAAVLKSLPLQTVLVVGQAHSFVAEAFDIMDIVIKENGCSAVLRQQ